MNIFDVGGIVTFAAIILTVILGSAIFAWLNKIFDITYFGFGAMIGEWFVCCVVAAFVVNFLGGLLGGIFSVIWIIIKPVFIIAIVVGIGTFIYNKVKGDKA